MATMWHKAMLYLGLGPDDDYDDYESMPEERPAPREQAPAGRSAPARQSPTRPAPPRSAPARTRPGPASGQPPAFSTPPPEHNEPPAVRTLPVPGDEAPKPRVRAVPRTPQKQAHVVVPSSFKDAQEIADKFKADQPVAMDLLDVDRELSRRLIDFSSGLCYGLGGKMDKVANHQYLLTPAGVEVAPEELRRLAERSYTEN